jgi:hypothetical protein
MASQIFSVALALWRNWKISEHAAAGWGTKGFATPP